MLYTIEKYDLQLIDNEDSTCKTVLSPKDGEALLKERRKLYLVYQGKEILYVGEAHTSIKTRFQRGCTSFNYFVKNGSSRGGYKGYKWLNKKDNPFRKIKVLAVVFDTTKDEDRAFVEAVEGELVYLIRNEFGYWPKFQNEIHFSNCDGAKEIAREILKKAFSGELV